MIKMALLSSIIFSSLLFHSTITTGIRLNSEEFFAAKKASKFLFVVFHPANCAYCDYLETTLNTLQANINSKYKGVKVAMVDADSNTDVKQEEAIRELPLVKFYASGYYFTYFQGQLAEENMARFISKLLDSKKKAVYLDNDKSFVKFNNLDYSLTMSFPEVGDEQHNKMQDFQTLYPEIPVFYTQNDSKFHKLIFQGFGLNKQYHFLFKRDFDEGDKPFSKTEEFEVKNLVDSIWMVKDPIVRKLTHEDVDNLFTGKFPGMILFDKNHKTSAHYNVSAESANDGFLGVRLISKGDEPFMSELKSIFGIRDENFPCLRILEMKDGQTFKYKMDNELTKENLKQFLSDFKEGKLSSYAKNDKPISNKRKSILVLNREQFYRNSAESEAVMVIAMIADRCSNCFATVELLEETRKLVKDKRRYVFGTVSLDYNDIDGVDPSQVPIIVIVEKEKMEVYKGNKTAKELARRLEGIVSEDL